MKTTGIVRKVDELGRIVLPVELRRTQGIAEGDALEIYVEENRIVLQKYVRGCDACESLDELTTVGKTTLCRPCIRKLAAAAR